MSANAAVIAVVVALAIGWYTRRWRTAEDDATAAKARAAAAMRAVWRSRGILVAVALTAGAFIDMWFRGKGR